MKDFFIKLFTQLSAIVNDDDTAALKYVRMWNNQLTLFVEGKMELFECPAAFIEFTSSDIQQLGEGRQLFYLSFKIHILHWQVDASGTLSDGSFEQNLDVYDLKDKVFAAIQKFQPGLDDETVPAGASIRVAEYQDYQHAGVYHYVQEYKSTLVDSAMAEPVGGSEFDPTQSTYTSGLLVVDNIYMITNVSGGADFTNIGAASNTVGVVFIATGTTPTSWGTGAVQDNNAKVIIEQTTEGSVDPDAPREYTFPRI